VVIAASARPALAADPAKPSAGAAALQRARAAWDNGDFDLAPGLFLDALTEGGLPKADVVDAYVRIGSALAIAHKGPAALKVFHNAALLDPGFKVPREAGKGVVAIAERARREQARAGSLTLATQVADEVDSGASVGVDVSLAPARATLVEVVTIDARDTSTAHAWAQSRPAAPRLHFDIPARLTSPNATIVVVVEARDGHDNQLGSIEKRVHVAPAPEAAPPPTAAPAPTPAPVAALTPVAPSRDETASSEAHAHKAGFWGSAWPYILGGLALAAGGAATYYFALRPTDDVTVGGPRVTLH
jgi:hypothetical protein